MALPVSTNLALLWFFIIEKIFNLWCRLAHALKTYESKLLSKRKRFTLEIISAFLKRAARLCWHYTVPDHDLERNDLTSHALCDDVPFDYPLRNTPGEYKHHGSF